VSSLLEHVAHRHGRLDESASNRGGGEGGVERGTCTRGASLAYSALCHPHAITRMEAVLVSLLIGHSAVLRCYNGSGIAFYFRDA